MIKLENIGKLNGVKIADWTCYMVEERLDHYTMLFESNMSTAVITQFRFFKEDQIKGLWTLKARMDNRAMVVSKFQTQAITDTQAISKDDFQTFDAFCRTLGTTLHRFNDILRHGIPTFGTSSLAGPHLHNPQQPHPHLGSAATITSVSKRINGGHSFGGHQIPKPPAMSAPEWYVHKEEVKKPTMWETFKEIFWDSTPMGWMWRELFGTNKKAKQAPPHFTNQLGHEIPMDKPLKAKKAWH